MRRLFAAGCWLALAAALPLLVSAQVTRDTPATAALRRVPVGISTISGVVLSVATGRPLRNARVQLSGTAGPLQESTTGANGSLNLSRMAITDASGRFVFARLAAGRYNLNVSRDSYLRFSYGQTRHGRPGTPIVVGDADHVELAIRLERGGVVTGTIFDEDGEPLRSVNVQAWRIVTPSGIKRLQQAGSATSDDRGGYRLFNLEPGDYLIGAMPRNTQRVPPQLEQEIALVEQAITAGAVHAGSQPGAPAYVTVPAPPPPAAVTVGGATSPVFFPGVLSPEASSVIRVAVGEERGPIDIQMQEGRSAVVEAYLTGGMPDGVRVQVALINETPFNARPTMSQEIAQGTGRLRFENVAPGRYTLLAQTVARPVITIDNSQVGLSQVVTRPPAALDETQKLWGAAVVTAAGESSIEVPLTLRPARSVSGTVLFEGGGSNAAGRPVTVSLSSWPTSVWQAPAVQAAVDATGQFTLKGVVPGQYRLRAPNLRSVELDGRDIFELPFEFSAERDLSGLVLTVGTTATEITGLVSDAANRPLIGATIVIAPVDEHLWVPGTVRIATTRTGPAGRYQFRNLPAGSYVIGVVGDLEAGGHYERALLETLVTTGTRVTLTAGVPVTHDLAGQ